MLLPPLLQAVAAKGYDVFTDGEYNLNLIGIRNATGRPDAFDDLMCVAYRVGGAWRFHFWPITTDPGLYYLMSPTRQLNPAGTAILVEGQYKGTYGVGPHGKAHYAALTQQHGPVKVWRDNNLDDQLDYNVSEDEGWFGINIHAASMSPYEGDNTAGKVGSWSAGCQVFQRESHFREFMQLVHRQLQAHPSWSKFTYTLISTNDVGLPALLMGDSHV